MVQFVNRNSENSLFKASLFHVILSNESQTFVVINNSVNLIGVLDPCLVTLSESVFEMVK